MYLGALAFLFIYKRCQRAYNQAVLVALVAGLQEIRKLRIRYLSIALVISFSQSPRVPHQAKEPASQLMDSICLAKVQSLLGQ